MAEKDDIFVTYKWLFATAISILTLTLGFVYFTHNSFTQALESKADVQWVETRAALNTTRIDSLCNQLDKMEQKQDKMLDELSKIRAYIKP